jgi:glycosyltransferase involved in cell wall biosynthesis
MSDPSTPPELSIVIPVYNEEALLEESVLDLMDQLQADPRLAHRSYELLISENGSTDRTVEIGQDLQDRFDNLHLLRAGEPNYGLAMRNGILAARGEFVLCDEIDLCDSDFYARALTIMEAEDYDLVVGSKALDKSLDHRPLLRRTATRVLNGLFRVFLGFHGTDTHGLKAFRRQRLLQVVDRCVVDKDLFASEFVIRAERMNFRMTEIPVSVEEKRRPSIHLFRRVPNVLRNLGRLVWVIRIANR